MVSRWVVAVGLGLGLVGCKQEGAGTAEKAPAPAPAPAAPVAVDAKAEEPAPAGGGEVAEAKPADTKVRGEPEATPQRQSLELLARRGAAEVRSIREERRSIYELFLNLSKEIKAEVGAPITAAQRVLWDERPEKLDEAAGKLVEAVQGVLPVAQRLQQQGEARMAQVKTMNEELQSKKKKHSEVKIDKLQRQASEEIKVGRNLYLIARSLLNEVLLYAQLGSLEMRAKIRDGLAPLRKEPLPHDEAQKALDRVLYELNVEGVELPRLD